MTLTLRPYQQAAVDSIYSYFMAYPGNPLVVCPTAAGKSVIGGAFVKSIYDNFPGHNQKIMVVSHVKELLEQNYNKIKAFWPEAPAGLYSAGLGRRDTMFPITVAGIQSVYKQAHLFGFVNLLLIDEAHLLSPDSETMYQRFINELKEYNPKLKIVGMTATPFRMKGGMLTFGDKRIFTDICYEITIDYLLGDNPERTQYIARLRSKSSTVQADLTGVRTQAGDFNQKQAEEAIDQDPLTEAALNEVFALAADRKSWLFFCQGVGHAFKIRDAIRRRGVSCETITGETDEFERERIIRDLREGRLKAVTNYGVLTTGFDAPNIDLVVLLRATQSLGLYIQMLGRGMRLNGRTLEESIANGKEDCLVLDYCGNLDRFGPINMIEVRNPKPKEPRVCPQCREVNDPTVRYCVSCNFEILPPSSVPRKFCPECDAALPPSARRCGAIMHVCDPCYAQYAEEYFEFADAKAAGKQYWRYCLAEKFEGTEHTCPICEGQLSAMPSLICEYTYPEAEPEHDTVASDGIIIADTRPKLEVVDIDWVKYEVHIKEDKPPSVKVSYFGPFNTYREWVTIQHDGFAGVKARKWWANRRRIGSIEMPPRTVQEFLERTDELREPSKLAVRRNGKFWEIVSVTEWKADPPAFMTTVVTPDNVLQFPQRTEGMFSSDDLLTEEDIPF